MTKTENAIVLKNDNRFSEQQKGKHRRRRSEIKLLAAPAAASRPLRNDPSPQLELVQVPVQELRLPDRKLRKLNPAHVAEIAGSIKALGFCVPIIIDQNNVVVDGAARLEAARQIGFESVLCIRIGHLTEAEL
jgi:ParB-like nuclease domain